MTSMPWHGGTAHGGTGGPANPPPHRRDNLVLAAPITRWEDAIPLGNGLLGGLLWGGGNSLRLSLDRGDLWDERTSGGDEWWKHQPWHAELDEPCPWGKYYTGLTPTKLPAGRVELSFPPDARVESFELNLADAQADARFSDGSSMTAIFSATEPVALLRTAGGPGPAIRLVPAGSTAGNEGAFADAKSHGAVAALGYPPAETGTTADMQWYVQDAAGGFQFCVCTANRPDGDGSVMAVAVTTSNDCAPGQDVLALARERCTEALDRGHADLYAAHAAWWRDFWAQSAIELPEPHLQRGHQLTRYLYGAGSRKGAPPIPLQGLWTADHGGLPPWKGDYHNDLNTQLTYSAYQAAGNFEAGESYLDFLWDLAPSFRQFSRDFYETGGLATPGVMSLAGQPLGGWSQYSMSPTMSAWNAQLFHQHWRYTGSSSFLAERAYPWCREVGQCMEELLVQDADGTLVLPRSSSPEIFDNSQEAWLLPNSNYDLMCLKMLFLSLAEMATALGADDESRHWGMLAERLGDYHAAPDGELLLDRETPLRESHRHLSNLIGIHPFNLITAEGGDRDRQRIAASLDAWDALGTDWWCGYSWSWMACLRARAGDGEQALRHLEVFTRAFTSRNGFHLNGDQTGSGFSKYSYRPFTLEGNFAAMQAAHEMLLQSWSPTPGTAGSEVLRLFPAMPWRWHDASFRDLRAEGGHRVSATRENNATTWLKIVAGTDGTIRIRDNFGGREPAWSLPGVTRTGSNHEIFLRRGEAVQASLDRPAAPPPEPADAARPVELRQPEQPFPHDASTTQKAP